MTIRKIGGSRRRFSNSPFKLALLAAALLTGVATDALADGSISGRVTSSTTLLGLPDTVVEFYDLNADDDPTAIATTDASGNYTANLPAGSYGILTRNILGYINEIHNNVPCSAVCDTDALTPVIVTNSAVTGIDFVLDPGGRITGRVTRSSDGSGIANVTIYFENSLPDDNFPFTLAVTDVDGFYTSDAGTATGNIYASTSNNQGYTNEVYTNGAGNPYCLNCDVEDDGALIPVTLAAGAAGINFILDLGGGIAGTVRDTSGAPLANVEVVFSDSTGNGFSATLTDASGNYSTRMALPAGNYFVSTQNDLGLVDKLYDNITCPGGFCNRTMGTPIPVTIGATASGRDFVLPAGGTIAGTVTNFVGGAGIEDVFVGIFTSAGIFLGGAGTNALGEYSVSVPAGSYFAGVFDHVGFANQVYSGLSCPSANCNIQGGTSIVVSTGATASNVNFALVTEVGSIAGTVTNAAGGAALNGITVQVLSSTGTLLGSTTTTAGVYQFNRLPVGSYYVRTSGAGNFIHQLYSGSVCINCAVTTSSGTLVQVTAGATTGSINFVLTAGGRISGTITNGAGGARLQGIGAQLFNSSGVSMGSFNSNAVGVYTTWSLPAGTYYVRTGVPVAQNFIDELWNNLPCVPCNVTTGGAVMVTGTATTTGIDFSLAAGGSISGTTTNAGAGGAPVASIPVLVFDSTGVLLKNTTTDALGNYTVAGLPGGNYFVRTNPTNVAQNYVALLYNGFPISGFLTTGTPVTVTVGTTHPGVNFAMSSGGSLSGTVTDGASLPLAGVQITVYSPAGRVVKTVTADATGAYTVTGLQAGTYYVATGVPASPPPFHVDELYDNLPCLGCAGPAFHIVTLPCTPSCAPTVTTGTPVVITNGTTRTGVDFALASGAGVITGAVTDAITGIGLINVQVLVYNAAGVVVKSVNSAANTGSYAVRGLAPGTYYARTIVSPATPNYTDEAFGDVPCAPCQVTSTTSITVTPNSTTSSIDFALSAGGSISGVVTDAATTAPLASVDVQLFNATGNLVKTTFSGSTGAFRFDGLPAATYYARTAVSGSTAIYADELYDNMLCVSCTVTTGTGIVVTNGATHSAVNFALLQAVTIAPISNVITRTNTPIAVPITVGSAAGLAGLTLTGSSSNPTLVPNGNLVFSGSGANRTLTITPASNQHGATRITVIASNSLGIASTSFVLVVGTLRPGDFDGDGKADITVYRPSNGNWYSLRSSTNNSSHAEYQWGVSTDKPVPGDYDGDGKTDIAVYRPSNGNWFILLSTTNSTSFISHQWGVSTDIPVPGDYDGDGKTDIAVYRPSNGNWFVLLSTTNSTSYISYQWGVSTDVPVPADYDGDGKTDVAVYRPSNGYWFVLLSTTNATSFISYQWGVSTDIPVSGDYDGDGKTDIAVYRPSNGNWFVLLSTTNSTSFISYQWGVSTDIPVPADYDGDGKTDIAVYRPSNGNWFVLLSTTNSTSYISYQWGVSTDIPVLKVRRRLERGQVPGAHRPHARRCVFALVDSSVYFRAAKFKHQHQWRTRCATLALASGSVHVFYEARPCGYALQRQMTTAQVRCDVIAPALMPRKPNERVKTHRRDARKLAELGRAGLLTVVQPPTPADEPCGIWHGRATTHARICCGVTTDWGNCWCGAGCTTEALTAQHRSTGYF